MYKQFKQQNLKGNRAFTQYFNAYVNEKTKEVWFRLYDFANQLFEQDYSPVAIARCSETCTIKCPPEPGVIVVGTAKDVIDLIKRSKRKDMKTIIEAALLGLSVEITRNTGIDVPGIRRETKGKIERKPRKTKQEFTGQMEQVLDGLEKNGRLVVEGKIEEAQEIETIKGGFETKDIVFEFEGQMVTNSRLVAWKFGKRHDNVIASIREILSTPENSGLLNYFQEVSYTADNGKSNPMFVMNRDGFSLLVMGFTGQEAMKFKIEFIEAFNKMEAIIKSKFDVPSTFEDALLLAYNQQKQIREQNEKIEADRPFNEYAKVVMENGKDMTMREFAILVQSELGIPPGKTGRNKIFLILQEKKYLDVKNVPYQNIMYKGWFNTVEKSIPYGNTGKNIPYIQTYVTPIGRVELLQILKEHYGVQ
jgi:anti-repressor protein